MLNIVDNDSYSRVPSNRSGWNNRGGGVDIVIIINNREWGLDGVENIL